MAEGARLLVRVGTRWFEAEPNEVVSFESWQPLIAIPWPTRFLGLFVCRGALVPVVDERRLGCGEVERARIVVCTFADGEVGVAAAEVRFATADDAFETAPLSAALDAAFGSRSAA